MGSVSRLLKVVGLLLVSVVSSGENIVVGLLIGLMWVVKCSVLVVGVFGRVMKCWVFSVMWCCVVVSGWDLCW